MTPFHERDAPHADAAAGLQLPRFAWGKFSDVNGHLVMPLNVQAPPWFDGQLSTRRALPTVPAASSLRDLLL